MDTVFLQSLPREPRKWLAQAVVGMAVIDGIVDEFEVKYVKATRESLDDKEEARRLFAMTVALEKPVLKVLKLHRSVALSLLLYLAKVAIADNNLTPVKARCLKADASKLGFVPQVSHKIVQWAHNLMKVQKHRQGILQKTSKFSLSSSTSEALTMHADSQKVAQIENHNFDNDLPKSLQRWLLQFVTQQMLDMNEQTKLQTKYLQKTLKEMREGDQITEQLKRSGDYESSELKVLQVYRQVATMLLMQLITVIIQNQKLNRSDVEFIQQLCVNLGLDTESSDSIIKWGYNLMQVNKQEFLLTRMVEHTDNVQNFMSIIPSGTPQKIHQQIK